MPAHDWKRVTFSDGALGNLATLMWFKWLPPNPRLSECRVWHCGRCNAVIAAHGLMSQSDARRRAKIPFDCHLQLVRSVHEH